MFGLFRKKSGRQPYAREQFRLPDFEISLDTGRVNWKGNVSKPAPLVLQALLYLMVNRDRWVSARELGEELTAGIWGHVSQEEREQYAHRCVAALRRSLGDEENTLITSRVDKQSHRWYRFNESAI
jgi:DNA-binding response OmpR family regulator